MPNIESWMTKGHRSWDSNASKEPLEGWELGGDLVASLEDNSEQYSWSCKDVWSNPLFPGKLLGYADSGCSCNYAYENSMKPSDMDLFNTYQEFESWCPEAREGSDYYSWTPAVLQLSKFKEEVYRWFRANQKL